MKNINILSCTDNIHEYDPHRDFDKYPLSEYNIQVNGKDDIVWDCVIVSQNLPHKTKIKCREGNLIYISGEPPLMFPCPHSFTEQFDTLIIPHTNVKHRKIIHHHGFLPWMLGRNYKTKKQRYSYDEVSRLEPQKTKLISVITSNQQMMPGHNKRVAIIERLKKDYPNQIDFYGRGYRFVDYKADALLPYMFHICMENSSVPDYWTEKIEDPVMALSVPIYAGCTNISDYLGTEGFFLFDMDDYDSLKVILDDILQHPKEVYEKMKPSLENLRKHMMEDENIIPFIADYLEKNPGGGVKEYVIKPMNESPEYNREMWIIRLKRFLIKRYFHVKKVFA